MTTIEGIRGGCDGAPLELTGEFTGYNNGPTMQIGLWISNDGEHQFLARAVAQASGPEALRAHLLGVIHASGQHSGARAAFDAAQLSGGEAAVDWAQISYDLLGSDPEQEDLDQARETSCFPGLMSEAELWREAARLRERRLTRWILHGER